MADKVEKVKKLITDHPDFPKKGILFRDIFPVLRNFEVFELLIEVLCDHVREVAPDAEVIVGLESRGFLFGPIMALRLEKSFVPVRKAGKLPGDCSSVEYKLEYGKDKFEVQNEAIKPGQRVVIVDDLLATGGTMGAAVQLMKKVKAKVDECLVVIELKDLKGRDNIDDAVYADHSAPLDNSTVMAANKLFQKTHAREIMEM